MTIGNSPTASEINVELGRASNAPFDINGTEERALAQVPTGPISFADFIGKSAETIIADTEFTAGAGSGFIGYSRAAGRNFGTMVDTTYRTTQVVEQIAWNTGSVPDRMELGLGPAIIAQDDFNSIELIGVTDPGWNGGLTTLDSSAVDVYSADFSGTSFWGWNTGAIPFVDGHTYRLTIKGPA